MATALLLTAAVIAFGLILAVGRLDRHLAEVNKIDLQHAVAEHPALGPLVAALKDPTGLEWGLRSIQLLLLLAVFATAAHTLPSALGVAWRTAVLFLVLGVVVVVQATASVRPPAAASVAMSRLLTRRSMMFSG